MTLFDCNLSVSEKLAYEPKVLVFQVVKPEDVFIEIRQGGLVKKGIKSRNCGYFLQLSASLNVIAQFITSSAVLAAGGASSLSVRLTRGVSDLGLTSRTGFAYSGARGFTGSGCPSNSYPLSRHCRSPPPEHTGRFHRTGRRCCQDPRCPGQS